MKKVLAILMCMVMCLSGVSVLAFYDYPDALEEYIYITDLLYELEIMEGDDEGNFNPDAALTRAEATAIMVRLTGQEDEVKQGETHFCDVPKSHWASGYINRAHADGIINGMGDNTFDPDGNVTYHQFVKMLVCLLHYELVAEAHGGWIGGGYLYTGSSQVTEITKGVGGKADGVITRMTAARLVYNSLDVELMDRGDFVSGIEGMTNCFPDYDDVENILTEYLDCELIIGVIDSCDENKVEVTIKERSKTYEEGEKVLFENGYRNTKELEGVKVTAYIRHSDGKDIFITGKGRKNI